MARMAKGKPKAAARTPKAKQKPKAARAAPRRTAAHRRAKGGTGKGVGTQASASAPPVAPQESGEGEGLLVTLATPDEMEGREPAPKPAPAGVAAEANAVAAALAPAALRLEQPLNTAWSLPEQFLLVALNEGWDDRSEKAKAGGHGAALAASLLLELALHGRLRLRLDRFQVVGEPTGDPALDAFAQEVRGLGSRKAQAALEALGRKAGRHISPWRGRLHRRGVAREERWRFLGVLPRSRTLLTDPEAKAKLENRLQRTLVGGTPDVRTILLFGLIDADGLLPELIPAGALAYNRKRIHALLAGRDPLGYRVDPGIGALQAPLIEGLLRDVRVMSGNRK